MIFLRESTCLRKNSGKYKKSFILMVLLIITFQLTGCEAKTKDYIVLGAASSITNVMEELVPIFIEETGINIKVSYGSSGTIKKQIEDGAPIDIFISASQKKMNQLKKSGKVVDVNNLLKNRLVFVINGAYSSQIKIPEDLLGTDNLLAIGEPDTVPAGSYAKEVLESLNIWKEISGQSVYGKNVRQVTDYINEGEVSSAFIYKTDLKILNSQYTYYLMPEELHSPIVYPIGIVKNSLNRDKAMVFNEFLKSDVSKEIFLKHQFELGE